MEPVAIINAAMGLARLTGLDRAIGEKLGGQKGAELAGRVVDAAQVITGATDPKQAMEILSQDATMQQELRLRVLDMENKEAERILADRMDARDMQRAALGQDDLFAKRFVYWFATAWSLFTMLYILLITMWSIPTENQRFADTILGFVLGTLIATMINFFFGSSRQSQQKDHVVEALTSLANKKGKDDRI